MLAGSARLTKGTVQNPCCSHVSSPISQEGWIYNQSLFRTQAGTYSTARTHVSEDVVRSFSQGQACVCFSIVLQPSVFIHGSAAAACDVLISLALAVILRSTGSTRGILRHGMERPFCTSDFVVSRGVRSDEGGLEEASSGVPLVSLPVA
ncbi:hypothetical protein FA13DRAFT_86411 [Coprinellus micaceus]|uniref:Uncharacterized protein n=1 Tax=Coprinellus micaceus TaxID=71717 RepID=A0A4Y7SJE8_COPMI|nr:hypothetical protein FA13DRAFT_86411 [Coprinellus micaceus]